MDSESTISEEKIFAPQGDMYCNVPFVTAVLKREGASANANSFGGHSIKPSSTTFGTCSTAGETGSTGAGGVSD